MHQVPKILFCHETLHVSGIFCAHHQDLSAVNVATGMFHAGYVAAQHPVHTLQNEAHIATAQQQFQRYIFTNNFYKALTLARFHRMLSDDGPDGPKYIEAI
jgi:hypothetical protein